MKDSKGHGSNQRGTPLSLTAFDLTTTPARMRERIAFEARGEGVSDNLGNTQTDWLEQFVVAAQVTPRLGGEAVMEARLSGRKPVTIVVRYSNSTKLITTDWRARDTRTGVVYNIRSVANVDEHKHNLDILAEEGVAV